MPDLHVVTQTEHSALGQCVIDQQMEILRIKQKAVSNLEEVQFELANLQVRTSPMRSFHGGSHSWISLNLRIDMIPSIDRIWFSSPKHAGARTSRRLFQCSQRSKHQALDVLIAPANGSGPLPPSTLQPLLPIRILSRQKSISRLPAKNFPNSNLQPLRFQPLSFRWTRKKTPRNRKPTPPSPHLGYCFGRKVSNPEARQRRCLCVQLLAGIRRTKGRRMARGQISRSPGS